MNWGIIILFAIVIFIGAYWWESNEADYGNDKLGLVKAAFLRTFGIVLFIAIFGGMIYLFDGDKSSRPSCGGNRYVGYEDCYDDY